MIAAAGVLAGCIQLSTPLAPARSSGGAASYVLVAPVPTDEIGVAREAGGVQVIEVAVDRSGYRPAVLLLRRGIPATIRFVPGELGDCNDVVELAGHDVTVRLAAGDREAVLPAVMADFVFRCGEGLRYGYVRVVDDPETEDLESVRAKARAFRPAGAALAPCCGY